MKPRGKLYRLTYLGAGDDDPLDPLPCFIDTFDGSNLGHPLAHTAIGTQNEGAIAVDEAGRRLYVTKTGGFPIDASRGGGYVDAYTLDGGIFLVGSFALRSLLFRNGIAVAP